MTSPVPSQARIRAMVKAASVASGVSVGDICIRNFAAAVRARHGIWRELRSLGFGYSAIGRGWGVDHTTVSSALRGGKSRAARAARSAEAWASAGQSAGMDHEETRL